MSLFTQVRQVLRRDVRDARWLLLAYAVTLGYAVAQGRALLSPQFASEDLSLAISTAAVAPALLAVGLLVLVSATLALHFAPSAGGTTHTAQLWLTLPIAPQAVWAARMLWLIGAFLAALAVTWLVLLPLPITSMTRLRTAAAIALNSGALLLAVTLLAIAAGSRRRLLFWMIGGMVAVPALGVLFRLLPIDPAVGDRLGDAASSVSLPVSALLVAGGASVYLLLRARHLTWWSRAGAAALAYAVFVANATRAPAAPQPAAMRELPSMLTVARAEASLGRVGTTMLSSGPADRAGVRGGIMDSASTRRTADAVMVSLPDDGVRQYTLRLHSKATAVQDVDRLVFRTRSATVRLRDARHTFRTSADETVVAAGDPLAGRAVRWLNAPEPGMTSLFAFSTRRSDPVPAATTATAEFIVDVERRQPVLLASIPLGGAAPSGPWRRFVGARVMAPANSLHTLLAQLIQPVGLRAEAQGVDRAVQDITFALLHEARQEALHLTTASTSGSSLGWALSPMLFHGLRAELRPVEPAPFGARTPPTAGARPDSAWLRCASLLVIGWRTVEHGALALEAPVVLKTAVR
jgi:hypothetical protein